MSRETRLSADQDRVSVVAGILVDSNDRVLIADRSQSRSMRDYFEFPGGKVSTDESVEAALARELAEELGITVTGSRFFDSVQHDYPDISVSVDFYCVEHWDGEPTGLEGQALRWVSRESLHEERILPADAPIIAALQALR